MWVKKRCCEIRQRGVSYYHFYIIGTRADRSSRLFGRRAVEFPFALFKHELDGDPFHFSASDGLRYLRPVDVRGCSGRADHLQQFACFLVIVQSPDDELVSPSRRHRSQMAEIVIPDCVQEFIDGYPKCGRWTYLRDSVMRKTCQRQQDNRNRHNGFHEMPYGVCTTSFAAGICKIVVSLDSKKRKDSRESAWRSFVET